MTLLILREEIVCAIVIMFIFAYTTVYKIKTDNNCFRRILFYALGHICFDMITVWTVNHMDIVPKYVNDICHVLFYSFGIAFIMVYYEYIIWHVMARKYRKYALIFKYIPVVLLILMIFFLPIEYVSGNGTNYSYGPLVFAGYGGFVIYCLICCIVVMGNHKKIELKKKLALYPMTFLLVLVVFIQLIVPELLMTSAAMTFVCLGLFASFNNPAEEYREQAYWDSATGIKNKNAYQRQLEYMEKKYSRTPTCIGFLICDMNGLKVINDNYGHGEGDKLIRAAADVLNTYLENAYEVYRVGGDEFVAVYISVADEIVNQDMEKVRSACMDYKESPIKLSVAMGYASGVYSEKYMDIYNEADARMYEDKLAIRKKYPELHGR